MNTYTPAPGDSVKLVGKANPDNVLYGTVDSVDGFAHTSVVLDGEVSNRVFRDAAWTINPWTRPVTFKPFAVVRLPEGWNQIIDAEAEYAIDSISMVRQSQGASHFWSDVTGDYELSDTSVATLLNHGAEILFEGVDTPGVDDA